MTSPTQARPKHGRVVGLSNDRPGFCPWEANGCICQASKTVSMTTPPPPPPPPSPSPPPPKPSPPPPSVSAAAVAAAAEAVPPPPSPSPPPPAPPPLPLALAAATAVALATAPSPPWASGDRLEYEPEGSAADHNGGEHAHFEYELPQGTKDIVAFGAVAIPRSASWASATTLTARGSGRRWRAGGVTWYRSCRSPKWRSRRRSTP